jgi:quercetin dioxygenase-like cupin family protein
MTSTKLILVLACLVTGALATGALATGALVGNEPTVTKVLSKDLMDIPGKEGLMLTVEYPPGGSDPIHRHNAQAFVYVLEGSIVMQVRGGKETTPRARKLSS